MTLHTLKEKLYTHCQQSLESQILQAKKSLQDIRESAQQDIKSSMGDKYETGPALLQQEKDKINAQLAQVNTMKEVLNKIDIEITHTEARLGSLLETNTGYFFLSIGLGKVVLEDKIYFCISLASPLGQALKGNTSGAVIQFRTQSIEIKSIV